MTKSASRYRQDRSPVTDLTVENWEISSALDIKCNFIEIVALAHSMETKHNRCEIIEP